jgi:hypothetical protein
MTNRELNEKDSLKSHDEWILINPEGMEFRANCPYICIALEKQHKAIKNKLRRKHDHKI